MQELVFSFQFVTPTVWIAIYLYTTVINMGRCTHAFVMIILLMIKSESTTLLTQPNIKQVQQQKTEIQLILNIKKASLASVLEPLISQSSTKVVWLLAWSFSLSLNNFLHQRSPQSLRLCHDIRRGWGARFPCQLAQVWFWCSFWPRSLPAIPTLGQQSPLWAWKTLPPECNPRFFQSSSDIVALCCTAHTYHTTFSE